MSTACAPFRIVRSSKYPQVTVFGDVQVFYTETGEVRHRDARGVDCGGRVAILSALERAAPLVRRVLQVTQLLTFITGNHPHERRAAQGIPDPRLLPRGNPAPPRAVARR